MLLALLTIQPVQANALPGPAIPAILNPETLVLKNVQTPAQAKVIRLPNPADKLALQRLSADRPVIITVNRTVHIL